MELYYVGVDGRGALSTTRTWKQIDEVLKLECMLELDGKRLSWDYFNIPEKKEGLFQHVLKDKAKRVDYGVSLEDRPNFCVISVIDNKAIRLEYYEGDKVLNIAKDFRAKELEGLDLPYFMADNYLNNLTDYLAKITDMSSFHEYCAKK